jgi:hypothetical protein
MAKNMIEKIISHVYQHPNGNNETINYRVLSKLGEGGFATCFKVENV